WIDNKQGMPYRSKEIPFKFEHIYRTSEENFSINKFHENYDNKGPTVVIIKVRNSEEIIGGYNTLDWRSVGLINDGDRSLLSNVYNNYRCKTGISKKHSYEMEMTDNDTFEIEEYKVFQIAMRNSYLE
ncbi:11544_t:CDS:2, partial [Gigaspora rosea]